MLHFDLLIVFEYMRTIVVDAGLLKDLVDLVLLGLRLEDLAAANHRQLQLFTSECLLAVCLAEEVEGFSQVVKVQDVCVQGRI
jgi:hypothetical protein